MIRYDLGDSVIMDPERCACGNPFPTISVEGRRDEIPVLRTPGGQAIPLQPSALLRVINETPGVLFSQIIQTGEAALSLRLEEVPGTDRDQVWLALVDRLESYLSSHGLSEVTVERRPEPPVRGPDSGKLRKVLVETGNGPKNS